MYKARRGPFGPLMTLTEYVEAEGVDPKHWVTKPVCPVCTVEVHGYDYKKARDFTDVSLELTGRKKRGPGFDHPNDPEDNCPNSFRNDALYEGLEVTDFDARTREKNMQVLFQPEVKAFNSSVLEVLMRDLTGKKQVSFEDKVRLHRKGEKWIYSFGALADHPWLLPYALVLAEKPFERQFARTSYLAFRSIEDNQRLSYANYEGRRATAEVPSAIQLFFTNEAGKKTGPFRRSGTEEVIYNVSYNAALAMI